MRLYLPSLTHYAGVSRMRAKISSLPHTWRNLPHGEALWTFTKTTHQNVRFSVKVKQKLKNLKQQRFMWDQKVASTAVNDWKQCIFSGIHRWNMRSSHAAGDFQLRSYSPQSLLSSVPGLFQAVVGKKSPASELGKVGRYMRFLCGCINQIVLSNSRLPPWKFKRLQTTLRPSKPTMSSSEHWEPSTARCWTWILKPN